jgi:hypothetical protein
MKDLIEALTILMKYGNPQYPTHCEHDELFVDIDPEKVSVEDKARLDELGFIPQDEPCGFISFRFGSC